jgi:hypothetical protein
MDFSFNNDGVPRDCRSFGRIEDDVDEDAIVAEFQVDGPGGEIINRVEIRQEILLEDAAEWACREGYLLGLKVRVS